MLLLEYCLCVLCFSFFYYKKWQVFGLCGILPMCFVILKLVFIILPYCEESFNIM